MQRKAFNSIQSVAIIVVIGVLIAFFVPRIEALMRDSEVLGIVRSIKAISQNSYSLYFAQRDLNISKALESNSIKTFEVSNIDFNKIKLSKSNGTDIFLESNTIDDKFNFSVKIYSKNGDFLNEISKALEQNLTEDENHISLIDYKIEFEERVDWK